MSCCGLPEDRVRWIIDDALKFVQREARRGRFYDGILMDPPSYGRGPGGEVWKLENELYGLAKACSEALSDDPLFFLINGYTTGFQASVLGNMIDMTVKPRFGGLITADEVCLPVTAGGVAALRRKRTLAEGVRWKAITAYPSFTRITICSWSSSRRICPRRRMTPATRICTAP